MRKRASKDDSVNKSEIHTHGKTKTAFPALPIRIVRNVDRAMSTAPTHRSAFKL